MKGRKLVAWNLRRIRVLRDLSQDRLALDADVDRSYVGRIERGQENPTVGVLDRLAQSLAVHVSEFFAEPDSGALPPQPLRGGRRPRRVRKVGSGRSRRA